MMIMLYLVWFFLINGISTYELKCPVELHRKIRVKAVCKGKSPENYSCLLDQFAKIYKESCSDQADFVRPGQKYEIGVFRKNTDCDLYWYQPFKLWSHKLSHCVFSKSHCNDKGQVMYDLGTTFRDSVCRCDHTEGYAFVNNPKNHCYCISSIEDCTCYKKMCSQNYSLTPDYQCEISFSGNSSCEDSKPVLDTTKTDNTSVHVIDMYNLTMLTTTRVSFTSKTPLLVVIIVVLVSVFVIYNIKALCSILLKNKLSSREEQDETLSSSEKQDETLSSPEEQYETVQLQKQIIPKLSDKDLSTFQVCPSDDDTASYKSTNYSYAEEIETYIKPIEDSEMTDESTIERNERTDKQDEHESRMKGREIDIQFEDNKKDKFDDIERNFDLLLSMLSEDTHYERKKEKTCYSNGKENVTRICVSDCIPQIRDKEEANIGKK